ncbi:MAG: hypothetical protein O7E52_01305 [Candidatus Poribacteria bacterium]|nr:hypothetical protein [Candidatus Poribacteria bacterium]
MGDRLLQIIAVLTFLFISSTVPLQGQSPTFMPGMSLAKYPRISEIRGDLIQMDRGEDYWIPEGQVVEIWRSDPMAALESNASVDQGQTYEKIGQARITNVGVQTATAQILGEPTVPIEVANVVRIHPEVIQAETGQIMIDRGVNHGLVPGWVVTLWRFEPIDSADSPNEAMRLRVRKSVGRAILTDVQPEMSIARILGKPVEPPAPADFIRIDKRTTVRQRSGNTVYLNVATDLINVLKPDMKVHAFRPYKLISPDGSQRVIQWQEKIATLKISHVAAASYTARAAIEGKAQGDVLPEDLVVLEDTQMSQRLKASRDIYVLKTEPDRIYLSRFEEATEGTQLTIVRRQAMSDEIDPTAPIYSLKVEAVYKHVVVATFLNNTSDKAFRVGDKVRYAIYR